MGEQREIHSLTRAVTPTMPGFTLRRMSWLLRTVRYEWHATDADGMDKLYYSPTFDATAQEWERALD